MVEDDSRAANDGNGTAGLVGANDTDGEWRLFGGNVMAPRVHWSSEVLHRECSKKGNASISRTRAGSLPPSTPAFFACS